MLLNGNCGNSTLSYEGIPALSTWFRSRPMGNAGSGCTANSQRRSASLRLMLRHAVWPSLPFWLRRITDPHMRGFTLDYTPLRVEVVQRLDCDGMR